MPQRPCAQAFYYKTDLARCVLRDALDWGFAHVGVFSGEQEEDEIVVARKTDFWVSGRSLPCARAVLNAPSL